MEFFDEKTGDVKPECKDLHDLVRAYFEGQECADVVIGFWEHIPFRDKVEMLAYWAECHLEDIHTEDEYINQQIEEAKKTLRMLKELAP